MVRSYVRRHPDEVFRASADTPITIDLTKDDFRAYVRVQMSGITNMFNVKLVSELSGLSNEKIFAIMKNYGALKDKWPEVVTEERGDIR